jgi:hypothetical protein
MGEFAGGVASLYQRLESIDHERLPAPQLMHKLRQ